MVYQKTFPPALLALLKFFHALVCNHRTGPFVGCTGAQRSGRDHRMRVGDLRYAWRSGSRPGISRRSPDRKGGAAVNGAGLADHPWLPRGRTGACAVIPGVRTSNLRARADSPAHRDYTSVSPCMLCLPRAEEDPSCHWPKGSSER